MENVEVAKIQAGQTVTLEFGDKEVTLTKLDEPRKFTVEGWFEEEREIYILDDVIAEDEILHYSLQPFSNLAAAQKADRGLFGVNRKLFDFYRRPVGNLEMEEEEEEES